LPRSESKKSASPPGARRLRVLHLTSVPFKREEGVSRCITEIASNMPDVDSHLGADRPVGEMFVGHHTIRRATPGRLITSRHALHDIVNEVQPDIVHLHGGVLVSSLALSPALRGRTVVATIYQLLPVPWREIGARQFFDAHRSAVKPLRIAASAIAGKPLTRRLLTNGGIAVVCTPDPRVAEAFGDYGPLVTVRGGATLSAHRATWSDTPTVGFGGRAEPGRGVEDLVDAVDMLRSEIPGIRLRLVLLPGPASEKWKVEFGTRPYIDLSVGVSVDLAQELSRCQVVSLPFRIPATITPPLVAAEAMSVGAPVIANGLSCISPLLVDNVNGMVAADRSSKALADALRRALADRATWTRLSEGARRTIGSDWSWSGAARATRDAYELALGPVFLPNTSTQPTLLNPVSSRIPQFAESGKA
jgi:alpha-maltose-1-phosphate synthase